MNNKRLKKVLFWICLIVCIVSFFLMVNMVSPWAYVVFVLSFIGTGAFFEISDDGFYPHPPAF